jgi:tetratricopeptide (TPR) repeat protein
MRRTLGVALVAFASVAFAQIQSPEVTKYLQAAITLYENLEYAKALAQVQKARTKAKTPDDEARCAVLEGVVLADMGKDEKATAAFTEAFSFDQELKLPVAVAPKIGALAERAREQVRKMLGPTIAAQKAAEEKRLADEKAKADVEKAEEERKKAEELARAQREDEERKKTMQPPPAVARSGPSTNLRPLSWIPGAVGLAAGGVATYFMVRAGNRFETLQRADASVSNAEARALRDSGKELQTFGWLFTGVAIAGIGTAAVMFLLGAPPPERAVSFVLTPSGGALTLSGSFDLPGGAR